MATRLRRVMSGKVRTEQRSPVAGGDIFGQHVWVAVPDCQPPLSLVTGAAAKEEAGEPQGHGPAPLLLTERGTERGMGGLNKTHSVLVEQRRGGSHDPPCREAFGVKMRVCTQKPFHFGGE
ncbi:hypothetical protein NQZ68_029521 [Dissostichus eleginoides]|nr:hypothetical protein NQZ68_029521 [Dissostichus eleginoides]